MMTANVLLEVLDERRRQDRLKAEGRFAATLADAITNPERLALLAREFGEVARCVGVSCDRRPELLALKLGDLRSELLQVAAVAVAWVEGLDAAVGVVSESTQLNR